MRTTSTIALAFVVFLAACGGGAGPESPAPEMAAAAASPFEPVVSPEGKVMPPPPFPVEEVAFPAYAERTLRSGARLIVVRNDEQPVASVNLYIRSGDAADPEGYTGVADMTAALLDKGTTTRSALDIAEEIDFIGGRLSASSSAEWTTVGTTVLTDFLDRALDLMADVVMNPTFPEEELETQRARDLSSLRLQLSQPGAVAQRRFLAEVYGDHPYGASITPASLEALDRDRLVAFQQANFVPGNAVFVVAGAVDADDMARRLDNAFLGWAGEAPMARDRPSPPRRTVRELVFVHKPGSVQAVIQMGHLMPPAADADWATFDVANEVLGGSYTSWLNNILRAQKGWTYGAGSGAVERPGPSLFQATTQTRNEVADSVLATMLELMDRIRSEPVPAEDLSQAVSYLTGSFPLTIETPGQIASQVASNTLLGRSPEYLEAYRTRIAAVDAAAVQSSARTLLHPDRAVVVVVGDATVLYDRLKPYADRARLLDVEGGELDPAALMAAAEAPPAPVDASVLEPASYTYAILYQGQPMGESRDDLVTEEEEGRRVMRATSELQGTIPVKQTAVFDAGTFQPIRFTMEGGRVASITMTVSDGRVTGTAVAQQGGTREVDMAAPPGLILSGMEAWAIAAIDLASTTSFSLPVLGPNGAVQPMQVEVTGEEALDTPAGSFDCYVLSYSGGQSGTMYVRKDAPHVMIRNELDAPPLVLELKEIR